MAKKAVLLNIMAVTYHQPLNKVMQCTVFSFVRVFSNGVCVFMFLSGRMRERGPCICGVGVWSLLLSLCLASLTQAHRSHTGRSMYVCVCAVHIPVTWSAVTGLDLSWVATAGSRCSQSKV